MRDSILKGLKLGGAGIIVVMPTVYAINYIGMSGESIVGALGGVCVLISMAFLIWGGVLVVKKKISFSVFVKSFLYMGFVGGGVGFWSLINAGWLSLALD